MAKLRTSITIDEELLSAIESATKDAKGGASGWINDACKLKLKKLQRAENRKDDQRAARRSASGIQHV